MLEKTTIKKLRDYIKNEYGSTCHKYYGSAMGERGHADLYGTTPMGRAYYIEVKSPTAKSDNARTQYQKLFLYSEALNGALCGFANCTKHVDEIFRGMRTWDTELSTDVVDRGGKKI